MQNNWCHHLYGDSQSLLLRCRQKPKCNHWIHPKEWAEGSYQVRIKCMSGYIQNIPKHWAQHPKVAAVAKLIHLFKIFSVAVCSWMETLNFHNTAQIAIKLLFYSHIHGLYRISRGCLWWSSDFSSILWLKPFSHEMNCKLFTIIFKMSWYSYNNSINL